MSWVSKRFGKAHTGRAVALLQDGSVPGPVYLDAGSGSGGGPVVDWEIYDGALGRPQAAAVRAGCACGWEGESVFPVVWLEDAPGEADHDATTDDVRAQWEEHLDAVEAAAAPVPGDVQDLLDRLATRLDVLTRDAPVVALRVVTDLEQLTARAGNLAASYAGADIDDQDGTSGWEALARGLGTSVPEARSRVLRHMLQSPWN